MSLEPIEPEAALELFLKDKEAELADASIKGTTTGFGISSAGATSKASRISTRSPPAAPRIPALAAQGGDLNKVSEKTQMDSLRSFVPG